MRANLADRLFVDAVRRRIGHHQRGQVVAMGFGLGSQIRDVHVPARVGGDDDDVHPRHHGAGRIGAVRRTGNEHDRAVRLAAALMPRTNDQQAGQLALRAGIGLQRHRGKSRRLAQRALELGKDLRVAGGLVGRRKRMQARELGPAHRQHLGGRVELHRAGAQRDHRLAQPDVLPLEAADVAHHLGLRVMRVEDGVRQVRAPPAPARPDRPARRRPPAPPARHRPRRQTRRPASSTPRR